MRCSDVASTLSAHAWEVSIRGSTVFADIKMTKLRRKYRRTGELRRKYRRTGEQTNNNCEADIPT